MVWGGTVWVSADAAALARAGLSAGEPEAALLVNGTAAWTPATVV